MLLKGRYEVTGSISPRARLATDRRHKDLVVVKEIAVQKLRSWHGLKRLEAEAETIRTVDHPAVPKHVELFALDEQSPDPRFFLVREYVPGTPLEDKLEKRRSQGELAELAKKLLRTVGQLHALVPELVHGDLTPGRIILRPDGTLAFLGFGLADQTRAEGLSDFAAPERITSPATAVSDLYSVGLILFAAASGKSPAELTHKNGMPQLPPSLPNPVVRLLGALLRADPAERPASAEAALELLLAKETALALPRERAIEPARTSRRALTAGAVALAAALEVGVAFFSPIAAAVLAGPLLAFVYLSYRAQTKPPPPKDEDGTTTG